jgi:predicted TIM-barrel fold metal-dependent hydrolase
MSKCCLTRRNAMQRAAAGALGLLLGEHAMSRPSRAEPPAAGFIDAHSHIWTRDVGKFPLAAGRTVADLAPPSFTAEELLAVARPEHVGRVVLICHHPHYGFDNAYLIDAAARYAPAFRIVAALDERQPHPETRMRELLDQRVTGFRITPFVSGEKWLESPGMESMWRAARVTGQAMCCLINPEHLPQVERMCDRHRETTVVIDHFARIGTSGEISQDDLARLCALARFEKVYVKVSAFYALGAKQPPYHDLVPMIRRLYNEFGPQRLMWASDAPYQLQGEHTYRASIALVRDHLNFLSEKDREFLLFKTAEAVYFQA